FFSSMTRLPPRPTLFPYTTLFRSRPRSAAPAGRFCPVQFGLLGAAFVEPAKKSPAPPRPKGDRNENPPGIGFWALLREDFRTHRSEEHTSELQSRRDLVCRLLLEK